MVEEYESMDSYGKPSRLWLFVCNGSDDYVDDYNDNDDGDGGNVLVVHEHDVDLGSGFWVLKENLGFRGEKLVSSVKGCGNVSGRGLWKGLMGRNRVSGRRDSDNSLRKLVLKQQLLARQQGQVKKCDDPLLNLGLQRNDDSAIIDLETVILDAKTENDVDSSGLGYGRIVPCDVQLPSDQNLGDLGPIPTRHARPLNTLDDNLVEVTSRPMESSMVNCGKRMAAGSVPKQQLRYSERVSLEYLNSENILPSPQDLDVLNSHLSCRNQASGSPSTDKSFQRGHEGFGHQCNIGDHQFFLDNVRAQGVVCPNYNRSHHMVRVDGKASSSARCYPRLEACTSISKQGHRTMKLDSLNFPRPLSGQRGYNLAETRRMISPIWNDRASAQPNRATIKKYGQVHHDVDIHSPQVMEDLLVDFSDEPNRNKNDVHCEQYSDATINCGSHSTDANFRMMNMGSRNVEQSSGILSNAVNPNGMLIQIEGVSELMDNAHNGLHPVPDTVACSMDVSSYNPSPVDSRASSEICEQLKMARLKLLDLMVEAKGPTEVKGSNDIVTQASAGEMQDHSHARRSLNDNVCAVWVTYSR